jgi:hypothetical protein
VFAQIDGRGVQPTCTTTQPPQPPPSGPASLSGTWLGSIPGFANFTTVLTQTGGTVSGTISFPGIITGRIDPTAPGSIDGNRNFELRYKPDGPFSDFILRGQLAADGRTASGGVYQSGFNGEPFTMTRQQ